MLHGRFYSLYIMCFCVYNYVININGETPDRYLTCPRPVPPKNTKISYVATPGGSGSGGYGVNEYQEHDIIYYYCKEGYSQVHPAPMYITCGSNGKWFPGIDKIAKCIPNRNFDKCTNGLFQCRSSKQCVSEDKLCDCANDCADGSDEVGCNVRRRYIMATSSGRNSAGIITSQGYPRLYPNNFTCVYHIYTLQDYRLEIDFEEFDLPRRVNKKCVDFIRLTGLHPKSIGNGNEKKEPWKQKVLVFMDTKCGKDKHKTVFSNLTHIAINVSLGHLPKSRKYRGFSLVWKVRSKIYVDKTFASKSPTPKIIAINEGKISNREDVYTVLTAVAISALLPLAAILFLCIHRHRLCTRRKPAEEDHSNHDEQQHIDTSEHSRNSDLLGTNMEQAMQLTENNLSKFNHELRSHRDGEQFRCLLHSIDRSKCGRIHGENFIPSNENVSQVISVYPDTPEMDLNIEQCSFGSNASERARYIMSYELPLRHTSLPGREDENSLKQDQSQLTALLVSDVACGCNNSPNFNRTLLHNGNNLRCSGGNCCQHSRNSYCSQNSNSCSICSPKDLSQVRYHRKYINSVESETEFQHEPEEFANNEFNIINDNYLKNIQDNTIYCSTNHFLSQDPRASIHTGGCNDPRELYYNNLYDEKITVTDLCLDCGNPATRFCIENHQKTKNNFSEEVLTQDRIISTKADFADKFDNLYGAHSLSGTDRSIGGSLICTH